jgi:hypothetical protein
MALTTGVTHLEKIADDRPVADDRKMGKLGLSGRLRHRAAAAQTGVT